MSDHWAVRWQKNGHDRLYVHGPDGKVGWVDLTNDQVHAETKSSWSTSADRAVAEWKRRQQWRDRPAPAAAGPAAAGPAPASRGSGLFGALRRGQGVR